MPPGAALWSDLGSETRRRPGSRACPRTSRARRRLDLSDSGVDPTLRPLVTEFVTTWPGRGQKRPELPDVGRMSPGDAQRGISARALAESGPAGYRPCVNPGRERRLSLDSGPR